MKEKLEYLRTAMTHPFDSFYEIRFRGKGSFPTAAVIVLLYGILQCAAYQYTGFIMNTEPLYEMNSISIFISSLSLIALFTVSNWTITTLLGGKGSMRFIFIVVAYSLIPVILTNAITVFFSNYIIEEEVMILMVVKIIGIIWFVFMALSGLCVIHEYTFGKNLLSLLLTAVAAAIIVFLLILFFSLEERMVNFVVSIVREALRR